MDRSVPQLSWLLLVCQHVACCDVATAMLSWRASASTGIFTSWQLSCLLSGNSSQRELGKSSHMHLTETRVFTTCPISGLPHRRLPWNHKRCCCCTSVAGAVLTDAARSALSLSPSLSLPLLAPLLCFSLHQRVFCCHRGARRAKRCDRIWSDLPCAIHLVMFRVCTVDGVGHTAG